VELAIIVLAIILSYGTERRGVPSDEPCLAGMTDYQ